MRRAAALSCCLAIASAVPAAVAGQSPSGLDALTAPPSTLPAGCALTPAASERTGGGRVVSGFWDGMPIQSNPWAGETPRVLAVIRTRMFGPSPMPDGPPDARIAAQISRTLVEGMSGYAAFYREGDGRVSVYALRSADPRQWTRPLLPDRDDGSGRAFVRITKGRLATLVVGDRGPCFESLEQHLRTAVSTSHAAEARRPAALLLDPAYLLDVRARGEKGDAAVKAAIAALEADAAKALAIAPMSVMDKAITPPIEPDGRQPRELERTRSWHYSAFNVDAFMDLATLGRHVGIDLWSYRTPDGRSIRQALDFMVPYAAGERKWTYDQITPFTADTLDEPLRRAAVAWKEPTYRALADQMGGSPRLILTVP